MINCPEKPHEKEDCININPETGEKCNAKNVKGTEKWSLCNAKESLIIGVDGSQYGGQPPPVYPSPEIEVEGEYFKLKAVLCYQDLGTNPETGKQMGHYYTNLSKYNSTTIL